MQVNLKTKDHLLSEGWKPCSLPATRGHFGMRLGTRDNEVASVSHYQERQLGKRGTIIKADLNSADPRAMIKIKNHTSWYPWQVLSNYDFSTYKDKSHRKKFSFGTVKSDPDMDFSFSCGCEELTKSQALQLTKWVANILGYKLVKK